MAAQIFQGYAADDAPAQLLTEAMSTIFAAHLNRFFCCSEAMNEGKEG